MMPFRHATRTAVLPIVLCCGLAACAPDPVSEEQRAASSEALFMENCSPCHGQQGRGPALAELRALAPEALREAIRKHPTAGQIPQRLPAADVQLLIEFIEE